MWPSLPLDIDKIIVFLNECRAANIKYGWGAKIPSHFAQPGRDFTQVDCSGFIKEAIWRASSPSIEFPDGSVMQHDWVILKGFERCSPEAGLLKDETIRIAFLKPEDSPRLGVGHIVLIHNGLTIESHGSSGPNRRQWHATDWQARTYVYLLTRSSGA